MKRHFMENNDGVHLMNGEYGICGDAWDGDAVVKPHFNKMQGEFEPMKETKARIVTCERCIAIIKLCKGVPTP